MERIRLFSSSSAFPKAIQESVGMLRVDIICVGAECEGRSCNISLKAVKGFYQSSVLQSEICNIRTDMR